MMDIDNNQIEVVANNGDSERLIDKRGIATSNNDNNADVGHCHCQVRVPGSCCGQYQCCCGQKYENTGAGNGQAGIQSSMCNSRTVSPAMYRADMNVS